MKAFFIYLLLSVLMVRQARAEGLLEFSVGQTQGTFTSEQNFGLSGWHIGGEGGYYYGANANRMFALTGFSRYASLSFNADGIRKAVSWYQLGVNGMAMQSLSPSLFLQLKIGALPYSKFFVASAVEFAVNDVAYSTETRSLYDGGIGKQIELGLFMQSQGKNKAKRVRYGIAAASVTQTFTKKTEHTTTTSSAPVHEDIVVRSSGNFGLNVLMISFVVGATF